VEELMARLTGLGKAIVFVGGAVTIVFFMTLVVQTHGHKPDASSALWFMSGMINAAG
jgi:hypothetical protein